ncbi:contractile injection system protein, VgrG/Pvc8 family [Acinetobacter colistiniresistens]|uniref:DNA primase n=1 Tax=Acinetobacter colistiniresistens TaxID=280145 RepID=A0A558FD46_9GAMM|nr:contractile injection system protein, VgrG/Pvc8 family [Acinetobacter colistiniresistens]TVT83434.1 DNA primase [Acinetobacter colistiniresistens]
MSLLGMASTAINFISKKLDDSYPHAFFKIVVNGVDIGDLVQTRLMRLTITDNRGIEADTVEIELSDHDGSLGIPPKGAIIEVWIGWSNEGLIYKGKYTIKEREHSGVPDVLTIRGAAADLKATFKKKKERSFDNKTIADIINTIASEQNLKAIIHDSLGQITLAHIDQNESDANLITRIADEHDAIATVKNGYLLFMPKGEGKTISGLDLPTFFITRNMGDSHRWSDTDGADDVSGVTVFYYDNDKAERQKVTVGMSDENTRELRNIQRDEKSAKRVAQSEFNRIKAKSATFSYKLAYGKPDLIPEMQVQFMGLKSEIDDILWLGSRVVHTLSVDSGFVTDVELEVYLPDADDLSELVDEDSGSYTGILAYYKDGKNTGKVTQGDQTTPRRLTYLYKNKQTATTAATREYKAMQTEKNMTK